MGRGLPHAGYSRVAIPSNRVNVSCSKTVKLPFWGFYVAIPSNRVNVSYRMKRCKKCGKPIEVAIPSNRVNVSYVKELMWIRELVLKVAIPSNRVNVSYGRPKHPKFILNMTLSQSPQIGSMFLTYKKLAKTQLKKKYVAIPSNRVNVSYFCFPMEWWHRNILEFSRNPLKSGQCFLHLYEILEEDSKRLGLVAIPSNRVNVSYSRGWKVWCGGILASQSPQIGSMFLTQKHIGVQTQMPKMSRNPLKSGQCFLPYEKM